MSLWCVYVNDGVVCLVVLMYSDVVGQKEDSVFVGMSDAKMLL